MEQAELTVARLRLRDGSLRAEGRLRHPNGHTHTIFFEVPRAQSRWITSHADPFVVAFIIPLMSLGVPVRVHGAVTARLLDHLTEFQRIMARWFPGELRPVEIRPDRIARPRRPAHESSPLLTFSGGTDSMFSAWSWMQPSRGGRRLRWAVMAHGFDIPLESADYFREYERSLRGPLADKGVTLFTVRTNGMETAAAYGLKWGKTHHGPATAALLLLFQKKFDLGVIASTYVCDNVTTGWGSTSLTDPLLGSGDMTILHDGAASDRVDKIRALAAWPEGLAVMRVCWTWPRTVANCGACYKCIYVRLAMAILGVPERSSFAAPLTVEAVRNLDLKAAPNVRNWERMLKIATDVNPASPWIPAIREAIDRGTLTYGGAAPPRKTLSPAPPSIQAWLDAFAECVRQRDIEAARSLVSPDVVGFGTVVERAAGRDDLAQRQWAAVWPVTNGFAFMRDSVEIVRSSDGLVAVVLAVWSSDSIEPDRGEACRRGRCTLVLCRSDAAGTGWIAIHTHFSLTP